MTTLFDVLAATKPPLELLDHLTRYQGRAALPDVVATWAERWRRIYAGDPDPLLDELMPATPEIENLAASDSLLQNDVKGDF